MSFNQIKRFHQIKLVSYIPLVAVSVDVVALVVGSVDVVAGVVLEGSTTKI